MDGELLELCSVVKLPTGVPDVCGVAVATAERVSTGVILSKELRDAWDDGVSDCVELLETDGELLRLLSAVKLPTGLSDVCGVAVAATEGVSTGVKLSKELRDAWDDGVSDCVELLDTDGDPVKL